MSCPLTPARRPTTTDSRVTRHSHPPTSVRRSAATLHPSTSIHSPLLLLSFSLSLILSFSLSLFLSSYAAATTTRQRQHQHINIRSHMRQRPWQSGNNLRSMPKGRQSLTAPWQVLASPQIAHNVTHGRRVPPRVAAGVSSLVGPSRGMASGPGERPRRKHGGSPITGSPATCATTTTC